MTRRKKRLESSWISILLSYLVELLQKRAKIAKIAKISVQESSASGSSLRVLRLIILWFSIFTSATQLVRMCMRFSSHSRHVGLLLPGARPVFCFLFDARHGSQCEVSVCFFFCFFFCSSFFRWLSSQRMICENIFPKKYSNNSKSIC